MLIGQASFEIEYGANEEEKLIYTFETSTGDFISIGSKQDTNNSFPVSQLILKINSSGEIINENVYTKPDTGFVLRYGYEKANGNYFLIGSLTDSVSPIEYNVTYVCERTSDLEIVWEKYFPIPEPYFDHRISNFIMDSDSNLIIEGSVDSSQVGSDKLLITMKIDKYGNQLCLNFYEIWRSMSTANEMIFNNDSTAINFFGTFTTNGTIYKEFIEMDLNLNITGYISIIDWDHFSTIPIAVKLLPNSKLVQANQATMEPGADHDLYVKIMDEELNTLRDTILFYSEQMYIPWYNGIDFIDQNQIWVFFF